MAEQVTIPTQEATETVVKEPESAVANGHPKTQEENVVDAPKKSFAVVVSLPCVCVCVLSNSMAQS